MLDVLVVDDSDLIRAMILKTLRMAEVPLGATYEAGNGREALEILRSNWVDLVLADINMPVMDGLEMVRHMRESDELRGVPVIIVSAASTAGRLEHPEQMGVTAFVRKPFTPEALRDVVAAATADWRQDENTDLVEEALVFVLERFTFSYGEPVAVRALPEPHGELLCAKMTFAGSRDGAISVAAPLELAQQMAANVLGGDAVEIEVTDAADALAEVLNMACGRLANALQAGDETTLTPPEACRVDLDEWRRLIRSAHSVGFVVEERPLLLTLGMR